MEESCSINLQSLQEQNMRDDNSFCTDISLLHFV